MGTHCVISSRISRIFLEFLKVRQADTEVFPDRPRYNQIVHVCTPTRLAFNTGCLQHICESVGIINNSIPGGLTPATTVTAF